MHRESRFLGDSIIVLFSQSDVKRTSSPITKIERFLDKFLAKMLKFTYQFLDR